MKQFSIGYALLSMNCVLRFVVKCSDSEESLFPRGPFALPMASDGCPEGSSQGWHVGYISVKTTKPFNQSDVNLLSCGNMFRDNPISGNPLDSKSATNILHSFDDYKLQLNFCFKSADHSESTAASWPDGIYGIYGAKEGCPDGFSTHNLSSCLPPILYYNSDGYLPYFSVQENQHSTVITFRYCRRSHVIEEKTTVTFESFYPFFVIKDPESDGCPAVEGFVVKDELLPGPIYSALADFNVSFSLSYCYFVSSIFENSVHKHSENGSTDVLESTGSSFVDSRMFFPSAEESILGYNVIKESWLMIDARKTYVVSGIIFQTFGFDTDATFHTHNGIQAHVSKIFVGAERWSFRFGGALRCRYSKYTAVKQWTWYIQAAMDTYSCFRSHYGRYITMVFNSTEALRDINIYKDTFISIFTYENEKDLNIQRCNEELGMADYEIKDSQLTATTWQESFQPSQARPSLSGWCARRGDEHPFIQIDLQSTTKVNGVVLRYWYGVEEETVICSTMLGNTKPKESFSFFLEFGLMPNQMKRYSDKAFNYDLTQTLETPQTYMFSEVVITRFIRILPTLFSDTSTPCLQFELLGCRKSYNTDITQYGTKIDQETLAILFEVPLLPVSHAQMLSTLGYPESYDRNTFYKWKISLPNENAFLQFEDISLRSYGKNDFLNMMACKDHVIVSHVDVRNPLTFVKDYFFDAIRIYHPNGYIPPFSLLFTSEDNGKMPGIPSTNTPIYLAFLSCSAGNLMEHGRGFSAVVGKAEFPVCMAVSRTASRVEQVTCQEPVNEIISNGFLGMDEGLISYQYSIFMPENASLVSVKIFDFEISCYSDSIFSLGSSYCNENVVLEEQLYMEQLTVRYSKFARCMDSVFPEGFKLRYKLIYRKDIFPDDVLIARVDDETTLVNKEVCSSKLKKCYSLEFQKETTWTDAANLCRNRNMQMVTIQSEMEHKYLRQLMIDMYLANRQPLYRNFIGVGDFFDNSKMFIGLYHYRATSGVHHEHWIDGTPLTVTFWNDNQPSDTLLKQCTKMALDHFNVEKENIWETETCDRSMNVFIACEKKIEGLIEKQQAKIEDCYETTASEYQGNVSTTKYGHRCQRWIDQEPNSHTFNLPGYFPDKKVTDTANYCRAPDGDKTPWCFTMDPMISWDYCKIPKCASAIDEPSSLPKDPTTLFRCSSGDWMSHLVKCNNVSECLDGSDEINCTTANEQCNDDEFTCTNGRCIHMYQVCNFVADCNDASDEFCDDYQPCELLEFRCDNGQCIPAKHRCDSSKQCIDGSDEIFCENCNSDLAFQCKDRTCISKRLVCDLHVDCIDGSDESSCDHIYKTCDDVWLDGLREDGIYLTGKAGYRTKCSFNTTSGFLNMEYLNKDWRATINRQYRITVPDMNSVNAYANAHGYICSRQVEVLSQRPRQKVMELKNETIKTNQGGFSSYKDILNVIETFDSSENRIRIHNVKCRKGFCQALVKEEDNRQICSKKMKIKGLKEWDKTLFCSRGLKSAKQKRWCTEGIEEYFYKVSCNTWQGCGLNRWNYKIFCSKGKSIPRSSLCIYDLDENRITDGCRTLKHLQNCENVPCPQHHFKCPNSYCVPVKYVCNGRIDCQGGEDEKECECRQHQNRSVAILFPFYDLIPIDRSNILLETATRLGLTLFSEQSTIRIIKVKQSISNKYFFESIDLLKTSEHPSPLFDVHNVDKIDRIPELLFGNMNSTEDDTRAIIWLTDTPENIDAENYIFSSLKNKNNSEAILKYRIVIGPHGLKDFSVSDRENITEVKIRERNILGTLGSTLFPDICKGQPVSCNGKYRCRLSMVCIPFQQVCNGISQCPYEDDEEDCDFNCPKECSCMPLIVNCANAHTDKTIDIPKTTRIINASNTTKLGTELLSEDNSYNLLISLNISRCGIIFLNANSFKNFHNLLTLDISFNELTKLVQDTFVYLKSLRELHMFGNQHLHEIEPGAFKSLKIKLLAINNANIERLSPNTFSGLNLRTLDLSRNKIEQIKDLAFNGLISRDIDIRENPITDLNEKMFDGVTGVEKLYTPAYKFCCIRPSYIDESNCFPYKDEFSSCKNLMRNTTLQALMWVIGLLALIGNVLSIFYRLIYDKQRLKLGYGMFVTNLAVSDFLMGVYMLIIALADRIFMDRYIEFAEYWRNSAWCQLAGILSTVSSEASVLFMCLITIDRILVVKFPFGQYRFTTFSASVCIAISWILSFVIALVPILYSSYFQNKFYNKSGVCLALPLTRDRPPGWLYAILIFVGFNLITFTLIAAGQLIIYTEIRKQSKAQKRLNVNRTNDLRVARNLLLLVTTDFMCWFPVGLMGILAMAGYIIPGEMYAWTAVLILPINSALNPFMYTFTAIIGRKKFEPSVTEQSQINPETEDAKAMLDIFPYIALTGTSTNSEIYSLDKLQQFRKLDVVEIYRILLVVSSYITLLHDNSMIIGDVCEKHILLKVSSDHQVIKEAKITKVPTLSSKKRGQANDINNIGLLADTLIKSAKI